MRPDLFVSASGVLHRDGGTLCSSQRSDPARRTKPELPLTQYKTCKVCSGAAVINLSNEPHLSAVHLIDFAQRRQDPDRLMTKDGSPRHSQAAADETGVSVRTIIRWANRGYVTLTVGEEVCDYMGVNCFEVWGEAYFDACDLANRNILVDA